MGLLPARNISPFCFKTLDDAILHITILRKHKDIIHLMDAVAEAARLFPNAALDLLALAYDILKEVEDKSRYNLYQARVFDFNIKPGQKVLDMGSGHIPFPLATHLADISLTDGSIGRAGAAFKVLDGKKIYECSVEETPFKDKEFDFVYCSHVLEHAKNPAKACRELMRIAHRGYIETPTKGKDVFLNSAKLSNHECSVELVGETLTFTPYKPWEIEGIGNEILMKMHSSPQTAREKAFSVLLYLYPRNINTMVLWEESFDFHVNP